MNLKKLEKQVEGGEKERVGCMLTSSGETKEKLFFPPEWSIGILEDIKWKQKRQFIYFWTN